MRRMHARPPLTRALLCSRPGLALLVHPPPLAYKYTLPLPSVIARQVCEFAAHQSQHLLPQRHRQLQHLLQRQAAAARRRQPARCAQAATACMSQSARCNCMHAAACDAVRACAGCVECAAPHQAPRSTSLCSSPGPHTQQPLKYLKSPAGSCPSRTAATAAASPPMRTPAASARQQAPLQC